MGKFLKDSDGNLVSIDGGLVLERTLDRKPRDCEMCGFSKWAKKDKVFIIQVNGGGMEWICPDCAIKRGLPIEFYHKNFFSPGNAEARQLQNRIHQVDGSSGGSGPIEKLLDLTSSLCR